LERSSNARTAEAADRCSVILDDWGWRDEVADNAIRQARTRNFQNLLGNCPHAFVQTSGLHVGLPHGQMGNSKVGHLNIGAGRIVMQDLPRITSAIANGEIKRASALAGLIERRRYLLSFARLTQVISGFRLALSGSKESRRKTSRFPTENG
jgi:2,3-bisphosphoglycerate-independent phosphoglycerate mutase